MLAQAEVEVTLMGELSALRFSRRSGRVHQDCRAPGADLDCGIDVGRGFHENVEFGGSPLRGIEFDDPNPKPRCCEGLHRRIHEFAIYDQHFWCRFTQNLFDLGYGEAPIQRQERGPHFVDPEEYLEVSGRVLTQEGDARPVRDVESQQHVGNPVRSRVQFREGGRTTRVQQRHCVGSGPRVVARNVTESLDLCGQPHLRLLLLRQPTDIPPLILMVWPVIRAAAALARNNVIAAMSAGDAMPRCAMAAAFSNSLALNGSEPMSAAPGVSEISDGVRTLMRTPSRLASSAAALEYITIAAIAAPTSVSPGVATLAASEATLMMDPVPLARIAGNAACIICRGGRMISLMRCCTDWIGIVCIRRGWSLGPVVFTSTSIDPSTARQSCSARRVSSGSVASTRMKVTSPPDPRSRIFSHAAAPRSWLRPSSTTRAPCSTNWLAVSSPTPARAPESVTLQSTTSEDCTGITAPRRGSREVRTGG